MAESILLVEDTTSLCEILHDFFVGLNYECDAVEDGNDACALLRKKEYDVILTDVNLPGCDGFAIIENANKLYPGTPKIIMTAFTDIDDVIHAIQLGAYDFIRKPIPSFDELRILIERAIAHRRLLRERNEHLQKIEEMNRQLQGFNQHLEDEIAARTRELSEANCHLKTLDQMKNNLLANISHELRTPLVSVRGYVELFLHGQLGTMPPNADKFLGICMRNIDKLLSLIDNLVGYAETASGEVDLHIEKIDLCACTHSQVKAQSVAAAAAGIELEEVVSQPVIEVMADRERLEQSLKMLIENAIKFNKKGTKVTVSMERTGRQLVTVSVADNGVGIGEEHLPHIFERFYQCDGSSTRRHGGTGIGLAIARDNLRLMGSELRVSSAIGRGANFYWTMPVESA